MTVKTYFYTNHGTYKFQSVSDKQAIQFVESEIGVLRLRGSVTLYCETDDRLVCCFND